MFKPNCETVSMDPKWIYVNKENDILKISSELEKETSIYQWELNDGTWQFNIAIVGDNRYRPLISKTWFVYTHIHIIHTR